MKLPSMHKAEEIINQELPTDNGKGLKDVNFYTGNKSKLLVIHIMQNGIEVDKPISTKIYNQNIQWKDRQYPVVPSRFIHDYKGIAHQYVDVNDVSVLTWKKDHEDKCKSCGGKMTIDARESRALGRRGIFHAIWGLDNTHIMLMLVFVIGAMAMTGAFFWAYSSDVRHTAELEASRENVARQANIIGQYQNMTGLVIGR